jgi:hypothetical protein
MQIERWRWDGEEVRLDGGANLEGLGGIRGEF